MNQNDPILQIDRLLHSSLKKEVTGSFFFEEEGEEEEKKKEENQTLFISFLDLPLVTGAHEDGHNNHKTSVGCV